VTVELALNFFTRLQISVLLYKQASLVEISTSADICSCGSWRHRSCFRRADSKDSWTRSKWNSTLIV